MKQKLQGDKVNCLWGYSVAKSDHGFLLLSSISTELFTFTKVMPCCLPQGMYTPKIGLFINLFLFQCFIFWLVHSPHPALNSFRVIPSSTLAAGSDPVVTFSCKLLCLELQWSAQSPSGKKKLWENKFWRQWSVYIESIFWFIHEQCMKEYTAVSMAEHTVW